MVSILFFLLSITICSSKYILKDCSFEIQRLDNETTVDFSKLWLEFESAPVNISLLLHKKQISVPPQIHVYTFENNIRQEGSFNTHDLRHYKGELDDCIVLLKICLHDGYDTIGIDINCKNRSFAVPYKSYKEFYHKLDTKNFRFETKLQVYNATKKELERFKMDSVTLPRHINENLVPSVNIKLRTKRDTRIIHTKYVELQLVLDHDIFSHYHHDVQLSTSVLIDIADALDTIYRTNNIRIVLVAVEIWNEVNKITMSTSADDVLTAFSTYASTHFKTTDNAHLLTATDFDKDLVGLGYVGSMCSKEHSTGVTYFRTNLALQFAIGTVAHELGHNFNMEHDDTSGRSCDCIQQHCIMFSRQFQPIPKYFSTCSKQTLYNFFQTKESACLNNEPEIFLQSKTLCGNNKIDAGEECDCGPEEFCVNSCCDPKTCRFTLGSQCAHGDCCGNCKILSNQTVCRNDGENECDVIDYCNGANSTCVHNYVADGTPCNIDGICYDGNCKSRNLQCKTLWGTVANDANSECYEKINVYGEFYGHCGVINEQSNKYEKCGIEDVLCGNLHCMNVTVVYPIIGFQSRYSKVKTNINGEYETCYGGSADLGKQQPNPGMVADYTPCGVNKYCLNSTCITHNLTPACEHDCGANGKCTNLGICQCNIGWAGSNCTEIVEINYVYPPTTANTIGNGVNKNGGMTSLANGILIFAFVIFDMFIY